MKQRTRLMVLATSTMALAGASLGRPVDAYASTCTDRCYSQYRYCTLDPLECYEYLEICLARCGA